MDNPERDLAETTAELSETLQNLRAELDESARGPFGLPRPPKPAKLLRFTEQYTIPTILAILEAAIRTLELVGAALRATDGRPIDAVSGESERAKGFDTRGQLAATSRATLDRLDDALADVQSATRGEPPDPDVRELLDQARRLSADIDERLAEAAQGSVSSERDESTESTKHDGADQTGGMHKDDGTEIGIDVDDELASIKADVDEEEAQPAEED